MSTLDAYFETLDPPTSEAFDRIRRLTYEVVPDAEEGMSYGMAALRYRGKPLLGFRAAKQHLSIFPFSPQAVEAVSAQLEGFDLSKGTIRFTTERPLPEAAVRRVVEQRLAEITST